jgi:hypothetical protein
MQCAIDQSELVVAEYQAASVRRTDPPPASRKHVDENRDHDSGAWSLEDRLECE